MQQQLSDNKGFMTLITVLIIAAVGVSISLSVLTSGQLNTKNSISKVQADQAKGLANTCTELALLRMTQNITYVGTDSVTLGQGSCTFTVSSNPDSTRTIQSIGTVLDVVRKIKVTRARYSPTEAKIIYDSWQEVADF